MTEQSSGHPLNPTTWPRQVARFFGEVKDDFTQNETGPRWHWHDVVTFVVIAVLLTVFYYWCRPSFMRGAISATRRAAFRQ